MAYQLIDDMSLYYEDEGDGETLFLLHGAGSAIDDPLGSWSGLRGFFSKHFRTVSIEHRGHGRTDNPQSLFDYKSIADDTIALADAIGVERFHLAGISDGAIVGLQVALTAPHRLRKLVLLGANYKNDRQTREANDAWAHLAQESDSSPIAEKLSQRHDRAGKPKGYWRSLFKGLADNVAKSPTYSEEELACIAVTTLLVAGERDKYANFSQLTVMAATMPNAELCVLNDAGHTVQNSHPHLVGPIVLEFLLRAQNT